MDLEKDVVEIAKRELAARKVSVVLMDDRAILLRFFVLQHRLLGPGPYQIALSSRAALRLFFEIPSKAREGAYRLLQCAHSTEEMWPHQSTRLLRGGHYGVGRKHPQHDALFNDWGIQHLHLGMSFRADGFIERTLFVAFIIIRSRVLYVIDIRPHGSWEDVELLNIVDRNWPALVDPHLAKGALAFQPPPELNTKRARKLGLTMPIQLASGKILLPPGGGYMNSGHSRIALTEMDRCLAGLQRLQAYACENETVLLRRVQEVHPHVTRLDLHVEFVGNDLELRDRSSGLRFTLPDGRRFPAVVGL